MVKNLPPNAGDARDVGSITGGEDPLEKGLATHSSILAWRIPWTEKPGRLWLIGSQKSRAQLKQLSTHSHMHLLVLYILVTQRIGMWIFKLSWST